MHADGETPGFYEFLKQEGILKDDSMADTRMEQHFAQNWGHGAYGNCIRVIFDRIESATPM